jgi:hypothetical protein
MTKGVTVANRDQAIDGERLGVEVIVSVSLWFLVTLAAFFFVGAVVGIIAILVGVGLFGWWLARLIRSNDVSESPQPAGEERI